MRQAAGLVQYPPAYFLTTRPGRYELSDLFNNIEYAAGILGLVLSFIGADLKPWHRHDEWDSIGFRKSHLWRLGFGILGLDGLVFTEQFATVSRTGDPGTMYFFVSFLLLVSTVFIYGAGPQNCRIDLQSRVCCVVRGWPFFPKQTASPLTYTSAIYINQFRGDFSVCLRIGKPSKRNCILGQFSKKQDALNLAQDCAAKLSLPVRE